MLDGLRKVNKSYPLLVTKVMLITASVGCMYYNMLITKGVGGKQSS